MGIYFNTGMEKFNSALRSKIYIDKTSFLEYTNSVIETEYNCLCISRPRRFKQVHDDNVRLFGNGCGRGDGFFLRAAERKTARR